MTITATSAIKQLLILFLVFAGLHFGEAFLMPLFVSALLATFFLPFCKWLEEVKLPKVLAALICVLVLLLAIAGIAALVGWQISELSNDTALIKQKANEVINSIREFINSRLGIPPDKQQEMLEDQQQPGTLTKMAGSLTNMLTSFILMNVYLVLLLYYRTHIKDFLLKLFPVAQQKEVEKVIYSAAYVSQQYLLGLAKMIGCLWIMYSIGFTLAGVKSSFFFAILCGLLEIVPFIGNITGTTITVLVSVVQGASLGTLAAIIATYGVVQFVQGWVLEPLIVGPQVKINALATVLALVLGEVVWGIPGIILAIPLAGMFKIFCDHIEPLKPYGFLIGEIKTGRQESALRKKIKGWFKRSSRK